MRTKSLFTPWLWAYAAVLAASLRAMPAFGGPIGSEASARPRGPEEFLVNGSSIPLISEQAGNIGDTWAGYIPVDAHDASRQMFFWLFPRNASSYKRADDSLIIWSPAGTFDTLVWKTFMADTLTSLGSSQDKVSLRSEMRCIVSSGPATFAVALRG